jgi:hypothetical protein
VLIKFKLEKEEKVENLEFVEEEDLKESLEIIRIKN